MAVNADFHSDFMLNYNMLLPPMLADGVRIMIYIGMQVSTGWLFVAQQSFPIGEGHYQSAPTTDKPLAEPSAAH